MTDKPMRRVLHGKAEDGSHVYDYFAPIATIDLRLGQRVIIPPRTGEDKKVIKVLRAYDKQNTVVFERDVCDAEIRDDNSVVILAKAPGSAEVHIIDDESEPAAMIYNINVLVGRRLVAELPLPKVELAPKEDTQ